MVWTMSEKEAASNRIILNYSIKEERKILTNGDFEGLSTEPRVKLVSIYTNRSVR